MGSIAVISNHEDELWTSELAKINVQHISVCRYKTAANATAWLINGTLQAGRINLGFGTVTSPAQAIRLEHNPFWKSGTYEITEDPGTATWLCDKTPSGTWLIKQLGTIQIPDKTIVQFIMANGKIMLRKL